MATSILTLYFGLLSQAHNDINLILMINGWQGVVPSTSVSSGSVMSVPQCCEMLDMLPCYDKAQLSLAYSGIIDWSLAELRRLVTSAESSMRGKIPRGARMKESLNHRDQHGVASLSCSR